jgi:hypothetical protein
MQDVMCGIMHGRSKIKIFLFCSNICCAIEFLVIGLRRKDEDQHLRRCVNCVLFLVLDSRSVI